MTPKEKAKQIVEKYETLNYEWDGAISKGWAKEGALIAVDEILNNDGFTKFDIYLTEYWQEVKQEIENL
jgi:hypothetical protein